MGTNQHEEEDAFCHVSARMADEVKQRKRYEGEKSRLEALLAEFITKRSWIKYGAKSSSVCGKEIVHCKGLLQALRSLQPNLSFKRRQRPAGAQGMERGIGEEACALAET
eukprot:4025795-Amphidinium_carterae.1